ncbi:hypothetical protein ABBQ32_004838 [Trebouxia sp. C0010 RCD-2024]
MSRQLDSASDAASSIGGSDAGSEAGKSEAGSQVADDGGDLLKESKFSFKAAVFSVVYSLKRLQLDRDIRLGVPTLFLEFLQLLILIFGPQWDWDIDWSNRYSTDLASLVEADNIKSSTDEFDAAAGGDSTANGNCSVQSLSEVILCF